MMIIWRQQGLWLVTTDFTQMNNGIIINEHSALNIQHSTFNIQHSTLNNAKLTLRKENENIKNEISFEWNTIPLKRTQWHAGDWLTQAQLTVPLPWVQYKTSHYIALRCFYFKLGTFILIINHNEHQLHHDNHSTESNEFKVTEKSSKQASR